MECTSLYISKCHEKGSSTDDSFDKKTYVTAKNDIYNRITFSVKQNSFKRAKSFFKS